MNVLDDFGAVCPALGNNAIINVIIRLLKRRDSVHVTKLEYVNKLRIYYCSYYWVNEKGQKVYWLDDFLADQADSLGKSEV